MRSNSKMEWENIIIRRINMVRDDLGNRMKEYESRNRYYLQRRTPVICRLDMRAGHSFTKGFKRPFDEVFIKSMQETAISKILSLYFSLFNIFFYLFQFILWLHPPITTTRNPFSIPSTGSFHSWDSITSSSRL